MGLRRLPFPSTTPSCDTLLYVFGFLAGHYIGGDSACFLWLHVNLSMQSQHAYCTRIWLMFLSLHFFLLAHDVDVGSGWMNQSHFLV